VLANGSHIYFAKLKKGALEWGVLLSVLLCVLLSNWSKCLPSAHGRRPPGLCHLAGAWRQCKPRAEDTHDSAQNATASAPGAPRADVMGRVVVKSTTATGEAVVIKVCHRDVTTYYSRAKPTCCNTPHKIPLLKLQSFIEYMKSTQQGL